MLEKRKEGYERILNSLQAMISNSDPTTAASLQRQLDELNEAWEQVASKSEEEGQKLDDALKNAEELEKQLTDMNSWLTQVHDQMAALDHVSSILNILEKQRREYKVRNGGRSYEQLSDFSSNCTMLIIWKFNHHLFGCSVANMFFLCLTCSCCVVVSAHVFPCEVGKMRPGKGVTPSMPLR